MAGPSFFSVAGSVSAELTATGEESPLFNEPGSLTETDVGELVRKNCSLGSNDCREGSANGPKDIGCFVIG